MNYADKIKDMVSNAKDLWDSDAGRIFMEKCDELNRRLLTVIYETLSVRNALLNAVDKFKQIEAENLASFDE